MSEPTLLGLLANDMEVQEKLNAVRNWWNGMNTAQKVGMSPVGFPVTDVAGLLGDIQMYQEQPETRGLLNYAGTAASMLPFVPAMSGIIAKSNVADEVKDLQFLHNTSAEKLRGFNEMGGIPMPSLAVTKSDIPFEGFGDITLIGKPESFDPKASRLNEVYSADAYTVRGPSPVRVARPDAYNQFKADYQGYKDHGYLDEASMNMAQLQQPGNV